MFARKETIEERQIAAAKDWAIIRAKYKRIRLGCLGALLIPFALILYFAGEQAGYLAGRAAACFTVKPERSTP